LKRIRLTRILGRYNIIRVTDSVHHFTCLECGIQFPDITQRIAALHFESCQRRKMSKKDKGKDKIGSAAFTADMEKNLAVSSHFGQALIKEAFKEVEDKQKKQVVKQVTDIMERLDLMKRVQIKTQRRIKLCEDQLLALNEGKFSIIGTGFEGVPGQRLENGIRYHESALNIDWSETERW